MHQRFAFICGLLATAPSLAHAGNDDELLAGNQAAMMGGAVSAFVSDSSAIWYDPAGLGAVTRDQVDVSGTVYTLRFYSAPDFISSTSGQSDDASLTEFVSIPTQIAYVRLLAPGVSLGLGYFVPQASNIVLREQLHVDGATGVGGEPESAWQVAIATASTLHNAAAALGFALGPRVRFGTALIGSYQAQSQSAVLFGAVGPSDAVQRLVSFTTLGTSARIGLELGLGLQLDLGRAFQLGLSARTPRVQLNNSSDFVVSQGVGSSDDAGDTALTGEIGSDNPGRAQVGLLRAGRYGVSFAYRYAERSRVCLEADVQPPLRDDAVGVHRALLVNARVGLYHELARGLGLGAGLFTDRTPDVLDGSPGNGAGDFYGATLGLELSNEHWLSAREHTSSLIFSSVFALRYAFTHGELSRFLVDPDMPTDFAFASAPGVLIAHELGLYVGSGLQF